jgi:hypothetical protein
VNTLPSWSANALQGTSFSRPWYLFFSGLSSSITNIQTYGATGNGQTDDTAAIQGAFDDTTTGAIFIPPGTYVISAPLTMSNTKVIIGSGKEISIFKPIVTMNQVLTVAAGNCQIGGLSFDGNHLARDCMTFNGANGTEFNECNWKNAKRHGVNGGVVGNNNSIRFQNCWFRSNGTLTNAGTVTTAIGNTTYTFSGNFIDTTIVSRGDYMKLSTVALPYVISPGTAGVPTANTVGAQPPAGANATVTYELRSGSGVYQTPAPNNNMWQFDNCYAANNILSGFQIQTTIGTALLNGCVSEANYANYLIGEVYQGGPSASPTSLVANHCYSETGIFADWVSEQQQSALIIEPTFAGGLAGIKTLLPVGYTGLGVVLNGRYRGGFSGTNNFVFAGDIRWLLWTYGPSITIDSSVADLFTVVVTDAVNFTINAPLNPSAGRRITMEIVNGTVGIIGVATWDAAFRMSPWVQPAGLNVIDITFFCTGTTWREISRTTNVPI